MLRELNFDIFISVNVEYGYVIDFFKDYNFKIVKSINLSTKPFVLCFNSLGYPISKDFINKLNNQITNTILNIEGSIALLSSSYNGEPINNTKILFSNINTNYKNFELNKLQLYKNIIKKPTIYNKINLSKENKLFIANYVTNNIFFIDNKNFNEFISDIYWKYSNLLVIYSDISFSKIVDLNNYKIRLFKNHCENDINDILDNLTYYSKNFIINLDKTISNSELYLGLLFGRKNLEIPSKINQLKFYNKLISLKEYEYLEKLLVTEIINDKLENIKKYIEISIINENAEFIGKLKLSIDELNEIYESLNSEKLKLNIILALIDNEDLTNEMINFILDRKKIFISNEYTKLEKLLKSIEKNSYDFKIDSKLEEIYRLNEISLENSDINNLFFSVLLKYKKLNDISDNKEKYDFYINILCNNGLSINELFEKTNNFNKFYQEVESKLKTINNFNFRKLQLGELISYRANIFNFAYIGNCRKEYLEKFSQFRRKLCPDLNYVSKNIKTKNKVKKVLFLSEFIVKNHSVFKDRHQIISKLSDDFDVYYGGLEEPNNEIVKKYNKAKLIKIPKDLVKARDIIEAMSFDIIVYCEIGMSDFFYFLSHIRLAKVQINTWGHSFTSGVNTIDYFMSSKLYELPYKEAQRHYSEKLILQNSLCTYYINPMKDYQIRDFKTKIELGIPEDKIILGCLQTPKKFSKDFMEILEEIAKIPSVLFLFINYDKINNKLKTIDETKYKLLKRGTHFEFMNYINLTDIQLDTYPFGGCNSSLEAFSLGKPVVTLPSDLLNGRFTLGFYKKMGIKDCIAKDKKDYIRIVKKLINDNIYKKEVEEKIIRNNYKLFNDEESYFEWKDFLKSL